MLSFGEKKSGYYLLKAPGLSVPTKKLMMRNNVPVTLESEKIGQKSLL